MVRGFIHENAPSISDDERAILDARSDEIAQVLGVAANDLDVQRIHAIDLRIRNIHSSIIMWTEIVKDEVADGSLENIAAAVEEITPVIDVLRQRVDDVRQTRQYLLDSAIPECKNLHEIVERGFPILEAYLETVTHIRETINEIKNDPTQVAMGNESETYRRLSNLTSLSVTQFNEIGKIGLEIQDNAAYLGYRKYLNNNKLEAQRNEPVNKDMLSASVAA